jgi:hypothetical protein
MAIPSLAALTEALSASLQGWRGEGQVHAESPSTLAAQHMAETKTASPPSQDHAPTNDADDGNPYCIRCDHGLFEPDAAINARLRAAGFSQAQAQLLYDLAAERLAPMVRDLAAECAADREAERLVQHFGGPERWQDMARHIQQWAARNLPDHLLEALAASADGVIALHRMMEDAMREPGPLRQGMQANMGDRPDDLHRMVADPRYWRDRDPSFVQRVTQAFRNAYE